ncbi:uncharacterized protein LOC128672851 [Plodia interpunctella]|uniref:uncharacterized protein LOC128672851 n=1 Tax=Plodia interpunctella TaxID=58824 RepID=UPI002367A48C|nr:uncharacterized protein LOC128672851 [Plodia interpunctella]
MLIFRISVVSLLSVFARAGDDNDDPVLYYYALEESERSLPACRARQACAALLLRAWRAPALLRLCRCARRERCDRRAPPLRTVELNNRAYFQFCKPVTDWPNCTMNDTPLTVESVYERINPDEIEELHHKNIQLTPPKITFKCRCRIPNYWRLKPSPDENGTIQEYQCSSLPLCKTDEFCGNVNFNLNSLYQSCLCPKHHMCVHDGGVTHEIISELLYRGKGWRAYCRKVSEDYSYEDY